MTTTDTKTFGLVGLGAMGYPMAQNLARKAPDTAKLVVYDLSTKAIEDLYAEYPEKVVKGESAEDVFRQADIIITMLPEGKHVRSVYIGSGTNLKTVNLKDKILIDSSTIDVETSLAVKAHITQIEPSASFYDAPVSGGVEGAAKGTLAFYIGIEENDPNFPIVQAATRLMGDENKIIPCGKASLGLVAKISHNYLGGVMNVVCCETMNLGIRAGLDPKMLYRVLVAGAARNPLIEHGNCVPGLVSSAPSSNDYKPGFKASLMAKDMSLALQMAETYKSDLVLGSPAIDLYRKALPDLGDYDFTALYRLFEEQKVKSSS
ncbi:NAD binding domain of 6-phosphogluconate dehydrogenase-domain-containing protein [Aspergillus keveii]|uniref:NAD binding domain of 6-phosphogluconate dehydrogenase-domain-containing protein n=1 Tax=Aspergillus keveii TaxID=714993 RepID=A0ABR4FI76_9EURO